MCSPTKLNTGHIFYRRIKPNTTEPLLWRGELSHCYKLAYQTANLCRNCSMFPVQFLGSVPGKAADDPSAWSQCLSGRHQRMAPCLSLTPPRLQWPFRVTQQKIFLSLCLSNKQQTCTKNGIPDCS